VRRPLAFRLAFASLLAALAAPGGLVACTGGGSQGDCPGTRVATVQVQLTRTSAGCAGDTAPAGGTAACKALVPPVLVDCQKVKPPPACCFDKLYPPRPLATLTVAAPGDVAAFAETSGAVAVCTGRHDALPLEGTHGGDTLTGIVLDTPAGAVLADCSSSCRVSVRQSLSGTLVKNPVTSAYTALVGTLTEVDRPPCQPCTAACGEPCSDLTCGGCTASLCNPCTSAPCGPCAIPCAATWTLGPVPP
jgi:hypothetical protein